VQNFWSREWHELRKRALVWLLLLSFVAVAFVMADQARTVEQQRVLIQVLQMDSQQLFTARIQDLADQHRKSREAQKPAAPTSPPAVVEPPKSAVPPKATAPPTATPRKGLQVEFDRARMLHSI
jgi:type IV secretory pathway VirB10-like protein